jgi:hypothetical protein
MVESLRYRTEFADDGGMTFSWEPVAGASRYRLVICDAGQVYADVRCADTTYTWTADQQRISSGGYLPPVVSVTVEAEMTDKTPNAGARRLLDGLDVAHTWLEVAVETPVYAQTPEDARARAAVSVGIYSPPDYTRGTISDYLDAMEAAGLPVDAPEGSALALAIEERRKGRILSGTGHARTVPGTGLVIRTDASVPEDEIRFVQPRVTMPLPGGGYVAQLPGAALTKAEGIAQHAAAIRERIVAALAAEIGDRDTAERLAGVVVRALEKRG